LSAEPKTQLWTATNPIAPRLPDGLDTPTLVIDLDIVERNAARMAAAVAEHGIALRPHVKTHKSVGLARLQLEHGAAGITVGTIGEAEVMAAAGLHDIFIGYTLWAAGPKEARLRELLQTPGLQLSVGVDSIAGVERLAAAVRGAGQPLQVLIELDPGTRRAGVAAEGVVELARAAAALGLDVAGLFTYGGHGYSGPAARAGAAADEVAVLVAGAAALRANGIEPRVLSAGSTPTVRDAARAPVTEVRPGTYLLGDRQQLALGAIPVDGIAIAVAATVVSTTIDGQVVIDAGGKALTRDLPPYLQGYGMLAAYPEGMIERLFDYHGVVVFPDGAPRPQLGEVVAVTPNRANPLVDLYDSFAATRSGSIVGRWPVDARGRSG
jgi:D-serine deaminase-like pyridoxal phosphate-dependent protein